MAELQLCLLLGQRTTGVALFSLLTIAIFRRGRVILSFWEKYVMPQNIFG
jgi:hypothetical protein